MTTIAVAARRGVGVPSPLLGSTSQRKHGRPEKKRTPRKDEVLPLVRVPLNPHVHPSVSQEGHPTAKNERHDATLRNFGTLACSTGTTVRDRETCKNTCASISPLIWPPLHILRRGTLWPRVFWALSGLPDFSDFFQNRGWHIDDRRMLSDRGAGPSTICATIVLSSAELTAPISTHSFKTF